MTLQEEQKENLRAMVEMSGYNNVVRLLLEIAQEKATDSKNWNAENRELWGYLAMIVAEASQRIEDAGYGIRKDYEKNY